MCVIIQMHNLFLMAANLIFISKNFSTVVDKRNLRNLSKGKKFMKSFIRKPRRTMVSWEILVYLVNIIKLHLK